MSPQSNSLANASPYPDLLNDFGVFVAMKMFLDGLSLDAVAKLGGLEVATVARMTALFLARFQAAVLPALIAADSADGDVDLSQASALLGYFIEIDAGIRDAAALFADAAGSSS